MWIVFSAVFWAAAAFGLVQAKAGGIILIAGCAVGIPALVVAYNRIYAKYKAQK